MVDIKAHEGGLALAGMVVMIYHQLQLVNRERLAGRKRMTCRSQDPRLYSPGTTGFDYLTWMLSIGALGIANHVSWTSCLESQQADPG